MSPAPLPDEFPSAGWLEGLASHAAEAPEVYQALGFANFRLAIEVVDPSGMPRRFGLVLDGYDVVSAGEIQDLSAFAPEALVTGALDAWREMLDNIAENGGADRAHTLNALTLADVPLRVTSDDPMGRDKFFRYAETLQTLFDATGRRQNVAA
ncbi:MAG: hypothetical protein ACYCUF_03210 [Acidimicrobiales bacterium]|nr:hypothetical protein [Actinomycetota bacterium]